MPPYADLELSLNRLDTTSYQVDFRFSQPESDADVRLPQNEQARASFDLEKLSKLLYDPAKYALELTRGMFSTEALRTAFAQAQTSAQSQNVALRLRLFIGASVPELHGLCWELLLNPQSRVPLAMDTNILFSRYLSSLDWRPVRLKSRGELKALVVVSNPSDLANYKLAEIDRDAEINRAMESFGHGVARTNTEKIFLEKDIRVTRRASVSELVLGLREFSPDVLYLVAHGYLVNGQPMLVLEDENGKAERVQATDLITRFRELVTLPRLVVLVSCQSGGKPGEKGLTALGPRLAEIGVSAVLAMQDNLSMETAAKFMPEFFKELAREGQIDQAVSVARGMVRKRPDAWIPTLTTRLKSGRLWYTPGQNVDGKAYDQWPALVDVIQNTRCTPVLGPGLVEPLLGSTREIARYWSDKFNYPMAPYERESLPQVAQFVSVNQPSDRFVFNRLKEYLRGTLRQNYQAHLPAELLSGDTPLDTLVNAIGARQRQQNPLDAHRILAQLPLPVYITANADELLEEALREAGREPQSVICPWNEEIDPALIAPVDVDHPLVFHFFGRWSQPESLVLTEDDYFRFLIGVTSNHDILPQAVGKALTKAGMLFLGFQADEWAFRTLFHTILAQPGSQLRSKYAQVAAQLEPDDERLLVPQRARKYLEKYLHDIRNEKIEIYWGSPQEFTAALWQEWEKREAIK